MCLYWLSIRLHWPSELYVVYVIVCLKHSLVPPTCQSLPVPPPWTFVWAAVLEFGPLGQLDLLAEDWHSTGRVLVRIGLIDVDCY